MHCGGLGTNPEGAERRGWGAVSELSTTAFGGVEPKVGIEPTTYALPRRLQNLLAALTAFDRSPYSPEGS